MPGSQLPTWLTQEETLWEAPAISSRDLRVSDDERNRVAEVLSEHFAEGRLDSVEFEERTAAALAAKTRGDLAALVSDLPGKQPQVRTAPGPHCRHPFRGAFIPLVVLVTLVWGWRLTWHSGGHVHTVLTPVAIAVLLVALSLARAIGRSISRAVGGSRAHS